MIGQYNDLKIKRFCEKGAILDGGEYGEILFPKRWLKDWMKIGSMVHVFVYPDTKDQLVATREKAYAMVGEFAFLQVDLVNEKGAYLDWGVARRLFVPIREQRHRMVEDGIYLVYIALNEQNNRIYGSAKYDHFIDKSRPNYEIGESVEVMIALQTDLGYKAIIDNRYIGMIYSNEIMDTLELGQITTAYIKRIREDNKIDLSLNKIGYSRIEDFADELYDCLVQRGGVLEMNDKSDSTEILNMFGVSKKTFKKAIGTLYRLEKIVITEWGIELNQKK